ncbi:CsiV family protein [Brumicola pallidula]|jgi:hypothetical protein|uniref:Uncharacterized protein n=1 Tax=Brumicola pallidula DSM 14239 = ACAM 615 TaxID=1121922 RepID=K6ZKS8_9ALTE|nr:CsiV family protein [Glaciecola pallidula]GAC29493.1 hypothetical protein GPAL_2639 [Glaciecola pallidula DSM 14239 = ACAM 615]
MQASASLLKLFINCVADARRKVVTGAALVLLAAPMQVMSQDEEDWWFDVEIIAFKRNTSTAALEEDFSYINHEISTAKATDLISLLLYRKANPLIDLQRMLYECSLNSSLYQSNLPLLSNSISAVDIDKSVGAISIGAISSGAVSSGAVSSNKTIQDDALNKYKLLAPILTSEARFSMLLDSEDCGVRKQEIASSLLRINSVNKVSVYLQQPPISVTNNARLLDDNQLSLVDYAKKLFAQRDISALSHMAWRQPVFFGEENASFYRVFSGDKLTLPERSAPSYETLKQQYDPELKSIIDQNSETFFAELKQQLSEAKAVNWESRASVQADDSVKTSSIDDVWELDGKVKVYLKYINRVPYLHIESEFEFHEFQLNSFGEATIEQYPFKQRRRVISKQIHYFDHPKMGLIIRLQRYEKPKEEDNENIY